MWDTPLEPLEDTPSDVPDEPEAELDVDVDVDAVVPVPELEAGIVGSEVDTVAIALIVEVNSPVGGAGVGVGTVLSAGLPASGAKKFPENIP